MEVVLISFACFGAVILNLAVEHRNRNRAIGVASLSAIVIGAMIYGYGYARYYQSRVVAVLHTMYSVCIMFAGNNDYGTIREAIGFQSSWVEALFWLAHFLAFYSTVSAAIGILGAGLLRMIKITMLRRSDLLLIYGINERTIAYGRSLKRSIIFVDTTCSGDQEAAINAMGAVVDQSQAAVHPNTDFLRRIGIKPGEKRIEIAAMSDDQTANLDYAKAMLSALTAAGIKPEQTKLLIRHDEADSMQWQQDHAGYGSVFAFDEYSLVARLLMRKMPPCNAVDFQDGMAQENFHAVIVGFGGTGRAVLEQLVMNGQFTGSRFAVDIFDPHAQWGDLYGHGILKQYDIHIHAFSGRSDDFYAYLQEHTPNYFVICTGNRKENDEIARELKRWYGSRAPIIAQCSRYGLIYDGNSESIYTPAVLDVDRMDRRAMAINQVYYQGNGQTAAENWRNCDYSSRMSCRAAADYYPAFIKASGIPKGEITEESWKQMSKNLLETLART